MILIVSNKTTIHKRRKMSNGIEFKLSQFSFPHFSVAKSAFKVFEEDDMHFKKEPLLNENSQR